MTCEDGEIVIDQNRVKEAKALDRRGDLFDLSRTVRAGVTWVELERAQGRALEF